MTPEIDMLDRVRRRLASSGTRASSAALAASLRAETGGLVGDTDMLAMLRFAESELHGIGPLESLLQMADVTDILVNGPNEVWVDRGAGLEATDVHFPDDSAVRRLAQRLATAAGRRFDEAQPWADVALPSGARLHAILAPIAAGGTHLSLRLLPRETFTCQRLIELGTLTPQSAALLETIIERRSAFLITGGTGSGKTTLLAALLSHVPHTERLVLVEDTSELRPDHPHVVRLTARPPNVEGVGEVTLRDLVRQALRMRPDRLVVGEVRGLEVIDLLAALNTGHEGGAGTLHANSPEELPARLAGLAALGGLTHDALDTLLIAAIRVVVHIQRCEDGKRRVVEVSLLQPARHGVHVMPFWRFGDAECDHNKFRTALNSGGTRQTDWAMQ